MMINNLTHMLKLCFVTNIRHQEIVKQAILGGITMLQLREKTDDPASLRPYALHLKTLLEAYKIPLVINDHVKLAKEIDADGVHIGQGDMHPDIARGILGPHKIIGFSIETMEQLYIANKLKSINYVSASAVFPSKTKTNYKRFWGIDGLREMVTHSKHPVTAIGGIKLHNLLEIMETGTNGVAVIGAINNSPDPLEAAHNLRYIIDNYLAMGECYEI